MLIQSVLCSASTSRPVTLAPISGYWHYHWNLHLDPWHCFTSTPCLSSSLLPASFIIFYLSCTPDEDCVSKALAFLTVLYVPSYRRAHFSRAVLFCHPRQQLLTHSLTLPLLASYYFQRGFGGSSKAVLKSHVSGLLPAIINRAETAQLVEQPAQRPGAILRRVWSPWRSRGFFLPESISRADSYSVPCISHE